jgi:hypothetical protein
MLGLGAPGAFPLSAIALAAAAVPTLSGTLDPGCLYTLALATGNTPTGQFRFDAKDPADVVNLGIDWTALLNLAAGVSLVSVRNIAVSPAGVAIRAYAIIGALVVLQVVGGVAGQTYALSMMTTDSIGNARQRSVSLTVQQR